MVNLKDMSLEELDILMEEITKEKSNRITEKLISQLEQYNKLSQELFSIFNFQNLALKFPKYGFSKITNLWK